MSKERREADLLGSLNRIRDRIQRLADLEAKEAELTGTASGRHWPEKNALIEKSDKILDELENLYAQPPAHRQGP